MHISTINSVQKLSGGGGGYKYEIKTHTVTRNKELFGFT
jgi:hypothetical protein